MPNLRAIAVSLDERLTAGWPAISLGPLLPRLVRNKKIAGVDDIPIDCKGVVGIANYLREYEIALRNVIEKMCMLSFYEMAMIDVDDALGRTDSRTLWLLGAYLVADAPHMIAGFTRYHCLAMCVADHLIARGILVN